LKLPAKPQSTPAAPAPGALERAFVQALYRNLFGREAGAAGLTACLVFLRAGGMRPQVAEGFWDSVDHRGPEVDQFHANYLHRAANALGRASCVRALLGGVSEAVVAAGFLASTEYRQVHASPADYLFGLYADVLGCAPDPDGLAAWQAAAQAGLGREALAAGFLASPEQHRQSADRCYVDYLGRAGEPAGVAGWLAALQGGRLAPHEVAQALLAFDEFYNWATR